MTCPLSRPLFLDEIGNLSYPLQAKLLTALQRRTVTRLGGTKEIPINIRLISATNRNLQEMVNEGTFREDLLYRINTIRLHLPPLRERRADIVPLARIFLARYAKFYNKPDATLSHDAEQRLEAMAWGGNIRELQHAMERAVIMADGDTIGAEDIGPDSGGAAPSAPVTDSLQRLDDMERQMIERAMTDCGGNMSAVAARLGISRQTLYNKIKRYGL